MKNSYWSLSEQERSKLTDEDLNSYLDVELMQLGILKVEPINLHEVEDLPIPKQMMYEVHYDGKCSQTPFECIFDTVESAKEFIDLMPKIIIRDYPASKGVYALVARNLTVVSREVMSETDFKHFRGHLMAVKKADDHNSKATKKYTETIDKVDSASLHLWVDCENCRAKANKFKKILDTRTQYREMCFYDDVAAESFLRKAFSWDDITAADAWDGVLMNKDLDELFEESIEDEENRKGKS